MEKIRKIEKPREGERRRENKI